MSTPHLLTKPPHPESNMRYLLIAAISLALVSCISTSKIDAPQDLTQEVPSILSDHYRGARFYSPQPEISEQAWNDFSREAVANGKPVDELPGLKLELQETIRARIYQAATGAAFLKVPYDLDEYEHDHEFLVTCSINGLNIASASSLKSQGLDLGGIFGKNDDTVQLRAVVADIEMNLIRAGERCGASSAQGFGPVTVGATGAREATVPIAAPGDMPLATIEDSLDAGDTPGFSTDGSETFEQSFSVTSAATKAITDAVRSGWPSLWATLAERHATELAGQAR